MNKVTIILPVHNGATTIRKTLNSLLPELDNLYEIIVIDDGSTDKTLSIIKKIFLKHFKNIKKKIIVHSETLGLASKFNDGIKHSTGDLIVTMHQDIILKKNALSLLIKPFDQKEVVASYHQIIHPINIWKKYHFWQKVLFDRKIGLKISGLDGKFDCFRKKTLIEIGMFDNKNFFSAGEDSDIFFKLIKTGKVVSTKATIIHLHDFNPNFNIKNLIYKQAQYSEAQGANLRLNGIYTYKLSIYTFFREILLLSLLIPYIRYIGILGILIYSVLYNKNTIKLYITKPQVLILPLINIYLLFVSLFFSTKGYIRGKQTI